MISLAIDDVDTVEMELEEFYARYERTPVTVKCKLCKSSESAPRRTLEERGWSLYGKGEFCPSH